MLTRLSSALRPEIQHWVKSFIWLAHPTRSELVTYSLRRVKLDSWLATSSNRLGCDISQTRVARSSDRYEPVGRRIAAQTSLLAVIVWTASPNVIVAGVEGKSLDDPQNVVQVRAGSSTITPADGFRISSKLKAGSFAISRAMVAIVTCP